ncbi:SDR family NAD(P)-dependent oxidoreductase [Rubrivirga marina]|uniref:3-oxoacyl-ACP reductase n=1 Tax=Rubrivirga marina TaxID=1196024 RepID=A0A271J4H7_9BACT|nr:SDR family oxidoreductase [Rubrivirga marina]PAP78343.1 3-oxoacyl-ACP reductase [Rubrivirga marina]
MTVDLGGRVALVTGASRGIGRAVAEHLGDAGATVGVHYGRSREAAEALALAIGNDSRVFGADLEASGAGQDLFDAALDAFGHVDVVVANAGTFEEAPLDAPFDDWLAAWDRTLAVNLRSVAELGRAAVRHARDRRQEGESGVTVRLVTVSSRAAFRGDDPEYLAYAASKGGVVALTKSLARAGGGLAAFGVAPGFTRTDMAAAFIEKNGEAAAARGIALDRLTEPDDVAPTVVFLASGLADHATGTTVDVNAASYVR